MPQKRAYEAAPESQAPKPPQPPLAALAPAFDASMDAILGALGLRGDVLEPTSVPNAIGQAAGIGGPYLKSLGKPLSELLDMILTTKGGVRGAGATGVPRKLRFTNINRAGDLQLHPAGAGVGPAPFEASPSQLDQLISGGAVDVEQPPQSAVDAIRALLGKQFDAAVGDPRNPTIGVPRENKSTMRRTLDEQRAHVTRDAYDRGRRK